MAVDAAAGAAADSEAAALAVAAVVVLAEVLVEAATLVAEALEEAGKHGSYGLKNGFNTNPQQSVLNPCYPWLKLW